MTQIATDAVVLHLFDYRETSRIVRLITRDAGLVSVVARGARRPRNRFGAALDLFASGVAQLALHATGDLHGLYGFDAVHSRPGLAESLDRFSGANVIAELCLRFGRGHESPEVFVATLGGLDAVAGATGAHINAVALAAAWRLIAEFGFAPALEQCAMCHEQLAADADVTFHHRAGGALCPRCAGTSGAGRRLPAAARATLVHWLAGEDAPVDSPAARAHARILREFVEEHLGDGTSLRAFVSWEERLATVTGARDE